MVRIKRKENNSSLKSQLWLWAHREPQRVGRGQGVVATSPTPSLRSAPLALLSQLEAGRGGAEGGSWGVGKALNVVFLSLGCSGIRGCGRNPLLSFPVCSRNSQTCLEPAENTKALSPRSACGSWGIVLCSAQVLALLGPVGFWAENTEDCTERKDIVWKESPKVMLSPWKAFVRRGLPLTYEGRHHPHPAPLSKASSHCYRGTMFRHAYVSLFGKSVPYSFSPFCLFHYHNFGWSCLESKIFAYSGCFISTHFKF